MENKIKIATTHYPIHELIKNRWSARAFSHLPIHQDLLNQLFEAASWASSSMNEQPWRYIYAHRDDPDFEKFAACLLPGNSWAKHAAVLILSLARKNFSANSRPNRHAMHDTGAANTNLMLEATAQGIHGHIMGGFDMEKAKATFNLPDDFEPVAFIALGYLGDIDQLIEPFKSREKTPRSRKGIDTIAFKNDAPADLI